MRFYHINYLCAVISTPYIPSPLLHVYFISSIWLHIPVLQALYFIWPIDFNFSYTGTGIRACLAHYHLPCASVKSHDSVNVSAIITNQ